jgi:hypothetical protein
MGINPTTSNGSSQWLPADTVVSTKTRNARPHSYWAIGHRADTTVTTVTTVTTTTTVTTVTTTIARTPKKLLNISEINHKNS